MLQKVITYKELRISLCPVLSITSLQITEAINTHSTLKLTAVLTNEMKAEIIHELPEVIDLFYVYETQTTALFRGRVTKISIDTEGDFYKLVVEAKSHTYMMDITRKSRSFQNLKMTSHEVIKSMMKDYKDQDCLLQIPNQPIGELVVQYEETDWEFIKRFVSRYAEGLYPENSGSGIRYYAGSFEQEVQVAWDELPYEVSKDIEACSVMQANALEDMVEAAYIVYKVKAYDYLALGTTVQYYGQTLAIGKIDRALIEGELVSCYYLQRKEGLRQPKIYNERLTGVSIDANIIDVKRNQVRVQLQIDTKQDKQTAYWFPYSTVAASSGGSGWHCMPEIGESVRAYFPVHDEKKGYVITNIKSHRPDTVEAGDHMADPTNKNISTAQDKQVLFTPEGVFIIADGGNGQVNLKMDGSVEITGIEDMTLTAVEEVSLRAENEVIMNAGKKVDVASLADGHFKIVPGGRMTLEAKEIFENSPE